MKYDRVVEYLCPAIQHEALNELEGRGRDLLVALIYSFESL